MHLTKNKVCFSRPGEESQLDFIPLTDIVSVALRKVCVCRCNLIREDLPDKKAFENVP
jgi:hypothetical protein